MRGRGRRQRPGREHSLTGAEGRSSRRLRQRRGSSSGAGSCPCGRRAGSIPPPNHPPPGPPPAPPQPPQPPLQPPQPPSAPAREREPARGGESARARRHRPQPPPPVGGASAGRRRTRARCGGRGRPPEGVAPPTHAVSGLLSRTLAGDPARLPILSYPLRSSGRKVQKPRPSGLAPFSGERGSRATQT